MGKKFPSLSAREVIRVLKKRGFAEIAQKGSHRKFRHANGAQVIVPDHGAKTIPIGTLKNIMEGNRLGVDDFS